jgi:hypothetical protein
LTIHQRYIVLFGVAGDIKYVELWYPMFTVVLEGPEKTPVNGSPFRVKFTW